MRYLKNSLNDNKIAFSVHGVMYIYAIEKLNFRGQFHRVPLDDTANWPKNTWFKALNLTI